MRNITPGFRQQRFSRIEIRDIVISTIVLAVAFMIMFYRSGSIRNYFEYYFGESGWAVAMFGVMLLLVALSFVGHELGHKFVAQNFGCWSEYRMYPAGLALAVVMSVVGFLIAAPGAVYIKGVQNEEQNGKISIAGPLVNIVLAVIGIAGCLLCNHSALVIPFYFLMSLNGSLALFNMLPIPPLDGSKILRWNAPIYIVTLVIAALLFGSYFIMPTLYWG